MTEHQMIHTNEAPDTIGAYSQAIRTGNLVFLSGQIPMDHDTNEIVPGGIEIQLRQVFRNLTAVCHAAGGRLGDIVKLTVYLVDFRDYDALNEVMQESFAPPYPARAVVGVQNLPKQARVEIDAIMLCN